MRGGVARPAIAASTRFGYAAAFLTLAAVAVSAFIFMLAAMPETGKKEMRRLERSREFPIPS